MKLEYCPICGESPFIEGAPIRGYDGCVSWTAICSNERCPMHTIRCEVDDMRDHKSDPKVRIADKWNERVKEVKTLMENK